MTWFLLLTIGATLRELNRNWLRSALTMLGVMIAVAAVIVIVGLGQGAQSMVEQQVATMGNNVIVVTPAPQRIGLVRNAQGSSVTLTTSDAFEIKKRVSSVREVCWGRRDPTQIIRGNQNWRLPVIGLNPGCFTVRGWEVSSGEFFTEFEMDQRAAVALLGQSAVERLFAEGEDPVGSTIVIKQVPFRVVGVLSPKGQSPGGNDQDDIVFIPFSTAQRKVHAAKFYEAVEAISVSALQREDIPQAAQDIREVLRERHRLHDDQSDDFSIQTQLDLAEMYERTSRTLVRFLVVVALIALLTGGIGIMNILLVSVTERTREIGVRMAVGAKRHHIMMQFLIEAMTLSLVGGALGIILGVTGAKLTTLIAGWPTIISSNVIVIAFIFSLVVGLFFGLYPANKAARMNPIEALRYE